MKIAVASGKGGTGKSMVAGNLAFALSSGTPVTLVDCDVEEPDLHLFFPDCSGVTTPVHVGVPRIDSGLCTLCGECGKFCAFGALLVAKDRVLLFPEHCHSCGGCMIACPAGAIEEADMPVGTITVSHHGANLTLVTGRLNEGAVQSVAVIRAARRMAGNEGWIICDASPGTSCPVVETLEGAEFCILVTESTPFGLHDLALALDLTREMGIPCGVVINRSDGKDDEAERFCREQQIPVLATIPFDRRIAQVQGSGNLIARVDPFWNDRFFALAQDCLAYRGSI
jgi:MinD superfamily P-loop ATPase